MKHLKEITKDECLEIAKILLMGIYLSAENKGKGWQVVPYSDFGSEYEGLRAKHERNDYYVDFDFDPDGITVNNDQREYSVAISPLRWLKAIAKLNELGYRLSWQNPEYLITFDLLKNQQSLDIETQEIVNESFNSWI